MEKHDKVLNRKAPVSYEYGLCVSCKNVGVNQDEFPCVECVWLIISSHDHWERREIT